MAKVTGLSGNEIYCLGLKNYSAGELVVGNSVNSLGFLGGMAAGFKGIAGGEITQVTEAVEAGRLQAFERMIAEARQEGAIGVAGVASELKNFSGNTEFLFTGSCLHERTPGGAGSSEFFSSAGDAQELYCHMDAGYQPLQHVFGNIAYLMGVGGGVMGSLRSLGRGEVVEYSDIFNATRHHALERIVRQATACGANAVVGIRTRIMIWHGTHEMLMTGTAARNAALPPMVGGNPVTSDLTGSEMWAMAALGYAPVKLLLSASIYSLGMVGGLMSTLKSFAKGEINELTTLIHDAREVAIGRLKSEADALGAEEVIGVKTYISELGGHLVELLAVGTAMKKVPGMGVLTASLPAQAIVEDKDTWVEGGLGFSLDRGN